MNPLNHVAIIMDGNGRWAISNSLNISKGHSKGVEIVRDIVEESVKQNISSLTLYAFSSENWSRPKPEIDAIKKLVVKAINEQVPDLKKQKVKLKFFGEIEDFGSKILSKIDEAETATNEYEPVLNLNVALGYGGRQDIVNLTKKISSKVNIPVIASGGVGNLDHLVDGIKLGKASAVLAASIFHYGKHSVKEAKEYLDSKGIPVRI